MSKPRIDYKKCDACRKKGTPECIDVCPVQVFEKNNSRVEVKRPIECIDCKACEVQCPKQAISFDEG